jgi:hypothetical protein
MEGLWSILPVVIEITLPVIVLLVAWICKKVAKKLDLQNKQQLDVVIESIVRRAVEAVEQLARVAKKRGDEAMTSNNKLARAVDLILIELKAMGLPELAKVALTARVEACLQNMHEWEELQEPTEPLGDDS